MAALLFPANVKKYASAPVTVISSSAKGLPEMVLMHTSGKLKNLRRNVRHLSVQNAVERTSSHKVEGNC